MFMLSTNPAKFTLRAASQEEMNEWLGCLAKHKALVSFRARPVTHPGLDGNCMQPSHVSERTHHPFMIPH